MQNIKFYFHLEREGFSSFVILPFHLAFDNERRDDESDKNSN